jgi:hypothetical protein
MIIKLDSGKELTLEEVKEVIDKFQGLLGTKEKEYIPYPVLQTPGFFPTPNVYPLTIGL